LSAASPPPLRPPYPGLASYGAGDDDAKLFFGRARERDLIIANLRAARLTVLHGPGGVGKSSLLHAGVMYQLRQAARPEPGEEDDDEPRTAVVILDDWSGDPAARLAAEIRALSGDGATHGDGAATGDGRQALLEAVTAFRADHRGGLLLILDQFEEYLRTHPDPREQGLDEVISELVRDPRLSARILLAIREDRLADLDRFGTRIPQLLGNVLRLGPLTPAAALEAIEGPIEHYATVARDGRGGHEVALEPGLAEAVRDQLVMLGGRQRGELPGAPGQPGAPREPRVEASFLQLVMRRLWDEDIASGDGRTIRLATLARLGGASEIVATHLDTALAGLSAKEQSLAAEMLRFLVTPSGATACLTARDLAEYAERPEDDVEALAEKLSRPPARILRAGAGVGGPAGAGGYELAQVLAEPALEWRVRRRTLRLEERTRRLLLALVTMTAVAIALVAYVLQPEPLLRLERASVDARFEVRGTRGPDSAIALVTLDDAAFARLKAEPRTPRAVVAEALDVIAGARPRAVAIDIIFTERTPVAAADRALIKAIHGPLSTRLVLATDRLDNDGKSQLFGRDTEIFDSRTAPAVAYAGFPADPGDVARRIERAVALTPRMGKLDTLGVATARVAGDARPEQLPATAWIDYRGGDGTFPRIAFYDVLRREPEALARLRGKIVVLGNAAKAVGDVFATSAPGPGRMDGPEIQANAISTARNHFSLRDGGRALDLALILVLGLLPLGLALRLRPALAASAGVAAAGLFCVAAQLAFDAGRVIAVVFPLASLALTAIGVTVGLLVRGRPAAADRRSPIQS